MRSRKIPAINYVRPYLYPKQQDAIFSGKRWSATEASTKSGKTVGAIAWIVEGAFGDAPGDISLWVAPVSEQAQIAFRRVKAHLTAGTFTSKESPTPTIFLVNGAIIVFKSADNPDSIYGEDYKRSVVDEASRMKEEAWAAVRSTLTYTRGPAVLIGNVKGRRNWFYELCRRIESGHEPNGHFSRITWKDAVEANVLDIEEIEDARRNLPEMVFRELYEAQASDDFGNPFGLIHIEACVQGLSNKPIVAWGLDLAKKQDYLVLIGLTEDCKVGALHRWTGVPWSESIKRVHQIVDEDTPCLVDSTGVGDPVLESLQINHQNFTGYHFTAVSKQKLMEGLAVSIQSHEIGFPDGPIRKELELFEYALTPTGVRYSAPEGFHDDCVCSLALARQQWASVAPGANVMSYMEAMTQQGVARENSRNPNQEMVREHMPWRQGDAFVDLDNELTQLYNETISKHPLSRPEKCIFCGKHVSGPSKITDGVDTWHTPGDPDCFVETASISEEFVEELIQWPTTCSPIYEKFKRLIGATAKCLSANGRKTWR